MTETPAERTTEPSEVLDQLQPEDSLVDRGVDDVLDEGYSPAERYSAAESFGSTADEQLAGETLDQRLAQEVPDVDPYAEVDDDIIDDGEVGDVRAGRLVDPDGGLGEDDEETLVGDDIGFDGAGASAEEAAVHVVDDEPRDD